MIGPTLLGHNEVPNDRLGLMAGADAYGRAVRGAEIRGLGLLEQQARCDVAGCRRKGHASKCSGVLPSVIKEINCAVISALRRCGVTDWDRSILVRAVRGADRLNLYICCGLVARGLDAEMIPPSSLQGTLSETHFFMYRGYVYLI